MFQFLPSQKNHGFTETLFYLPFVMVLGGAVRKEIKPVSTPILFLKR